MRLPLLALLLSGASLPLGTNLLVNGDAELGDAGVPPDAPAPVGWTRTGDAGQALYGTDSSWLRVTDPGPPNRGLAYFIGAPRSQTDSEMRQDVDLTAAAGEIDRGALTYVASAWLGGWSSQNDNARMTLSFDDVFGGTLATVVLGPVLAPERNNVASLLYREADGGVPAYTRRVRVSVQFQYTDGGGVDDDGYADNLSLILYGPDAGADLPLDVGCDCSSVPLAPAALALCLFVAALATKVGRSRT